MIAVIDNYDSFTWNLVQYFRELGAEVEVFRNDALTVEELSQRNPSGLVISPGPGGPDEAGISLDAVTAQLQKDGVEAFAKSFNEIRETTAAKAEKIKKATAA